MKSQLTYHCHMKEWELLKRFSSSQTARMDSWYIICRYHNKNAIPGIRTIKTIENGIYRFHCTFRVDCSDSLLELTYIRDRFLTFIHALILIILAGISCIGIFSFTLPSFFGGLCGLVSCWFFFRSSWKSRLSLIWINIYRRLFYLRNPDLPSSGLSCPLCMLLML